MKTPGCIRNAPSRLEASRRWLSKTRKPPGSRADRGANRQPRCPRPTSTSRPRTSWILHEWGWPRRDSLGRSPPATHDAYNLFCGVSALALARAFRPTDAASDCLAAAASTSASRLLPASCNFLPASFLPPGALSSSTSTACPHGPAVSTSSSPFPIPLARVHSTTCI